MHKWLNAIQNQSIRSRLIIWFLLISLIPICWTAIIFYFVSKHILFNQATRHLEVLVKRQENLLKDYFIDKKLDADQLSTNPIIIQALETLSEDLNLYGKLSPEYQMTKLKFSSVLEMQMETLDYQEFWLITKEGNIIFSNISSQIVGQNVLDPIKFSHLEKIVENSLYSAQPYMTSLIFSKTKNFFTSYLSIPLVSKEEKIIGVVLIKFNNAVIYQMLSAYNELGIADVLIAFQFNGKLYVTNPQASQKLNEEINPKTHFGQFIQQALNQEYTMDTDVVYLGNENIVVGRRFTENSNWSLVTIINQRQLLKPIHHLYYFVWILLPLTAFAVILAASQVAKKIASPILALTKKTNILASGDLSQRIQINSKDEIGRLGASFNTMASKLHHLINHLDDLVAKRTKEYEIQNIQLAQTIKELRQTRDRLVTQEKLASLGGLTAGIAHEIKNPLNFIMNFAELNLQLESDISDLLVPVKKLISESQKQELEEAFNTLKLNISKVLEHSKRADSIIYNMLQHSRGSPGEKMSTHLHKLLNEYIALSYHGMRAQNTHFNVAIEKNFDPSISMVSIVPQEISRVILNLLNNAYYSVLHKQNQQPSSYQPKIRITTQQEQDLIMIKIWDNGLGISSEIFPKLFTPFFTTKPPGEGTGLGLSLSYNIIVQGHNGTLSAISQLGEFAEFTVTLPYSKEK